MSQSASVAEDVQVQWHVLGGEQFEDALTGAFDGNYKRVSPAWLDSPKLKYYFPRSGLVQTEDTRVFFLATLPGEGREGRHKAIGVLEIAMQDASQSMVGIKYVTVDVAHRRRGIARQLYSLLIEHLKANDLKFYRTRPGQETPEGFTQEVTNLLDTAGVQWTRRAY